VNPDTRQQEGRPDPDKLLKLIASESGAHARGHLKVFFGASAGVGKTYAMLAEARRLLKDGRDVVVGVVEHHGRGETAALAEGLPVLPLLEIDHRGIKVREFDLDGALKRRPGLILMDEFAHTNAPGSRHPKRWQDVEELLDAGIDVYTTLNVQHLESVNDQVAKLTGVWVRETVPDKVFDAADEIALIDIPSEDLLKRLADGKVYVAEGANTRAAENFFKKSNLLALRELALRHTAERVDAQGDELNAAMGHNEAQIGEKIMVLVGADALSARLIRHARRMAARAKARWFAVYLQTDRHELLSDDARLAVEHNLSLAEELGAQVVRLNATHAATEIVDYAQRNGFTRIVLGYRVMTLWQRVLNWRWGSSLSSKLIKRSAGIEVTTLSDRTGEARQAEPRVGRSRFSPYVAKPMAYVWTTLIIAVVTVIGLPVRALATPDTLTLLYLTGAVIAAARYGIAPALYATALSVAAFNWFYTQPYYTFSFYDPHFYFTFAFMAATSIIVGSLTARLSLHARMARQGEAETRLLYDLTRGLSSVRGFEAMADAAIRRLGPALSAHVRIWTGEGTATRLFAVDGKPVELKEQSAVEWVMQNGQMAGRATDTMPSAEGLYLPLQAENEVLGVLGLAPDQPQRAFTGAEILQFETFASVIASALQRARRSDEAAQSKVESENEKLRNVLLSSLSHDLRTPLTVMKGSVSTMLQMRKDLPRKAMEELTGLWTQLNRLQKFVGSLLDMAAITSGQMRFNFQPYMIQEIIGAAITQVQATKENRLIRTQVTGTIPMVMIDGALIEQVFINLIENAFQHTAPNGEIAIFVEKDADRVRVRVSDNGEGLKDGDEARIFEQFQTGQTESSDRSGGTGLGLAICRGIIQAHGGMIYARNNRALSRAEGRSATGASFIFTLPIAKIE
jgi:two-component system sensor histidine kinase KdpD